MHEIKCTDQPLINSVKVILRYENVDEKMKKIEKMDTNYSNIRIPNINTF